MGGTVAPSYANARYGSSERRKSGRPFSPRAPGRWAELRDSLADAPSFMEAWPDLAERLVGHPLVAHNAATERTILEKRAPLTPFGPWNDTLALVRARWPRLPSYSLGDLIATFGLTERVDDLVGIGPRAAV